MGLSIRTQIKARVTGALAPVGYLYLGHGDLFDILTLRAHEKITSQSLGGEAPGGQGVKVQEYLDIPSFHNAARWDASPDKM